MLVVISLYSPLANVGGHTVLVKAVEDEAGESGQQNEYDMLRELQQWSKIGNAGDDRKEERTGELRTLAENVSCPGIFRATSSSHGSLSGVGLVGRSSIQELQLSLGVFFKSLRAITRYDHDSRRIHSPKNWRAIRLTLTSTGALLLSAQIVTYCTSSLTD